LDEVVATDEETGGEIFQFHDVLAADQEDPATKASRKMDWQTFMAGLSERERVAIQFLVEGKTLRKAAHVLRTSDSSMQSSTRDLRAKILLFMGIDILAQVQRRPKRKQNLDARRERMALQYDRCHV
jgi:FixJ family two-component response regulator